MFETTPRDVVNVYFLGGGDLSLSYMAGSYQFHAIAVDEASLQAQDHSPHQ